MYNESESGGFTTIEIICDARKGKGVCGNLADITMQDREAIINLLYMMGWCMLRGHQVCGVCIKRGKVTFPRKAKDDGVKF